MKYLEINKDGAIIGQFDYEPNIGEGHTVIYTDLPPVNMLKPRWIANSWKETASRTELEEEIDRQTQLSILTWCKSKGKSEEYYINCGIKVAIDKIEDTTDINVRHYKEYRDYVETQIKLGKAKKAALS